MDVRHVIQRRLPGSKVTDLQAVLIFVGIFALLPLGVGRYPRYLFNMIVVLALFGLSLHILMGYTGLWSFGHAGFYAAGAYLFAIFIETYALHPALSFVVMCLGVLALSLVIGWISIRLSEIYFAIITLAFSMLIYYLIQQQRDFTGGDTGFTLHSSSLDFGIGLGSGLSYHYVSLVVFLACALILYKVVNSSFGHQLRLIRENEERAEAIGLNVNRYKLAAFLIAGLFGGIAGALYAGLQNTITPYTAHWFNSAIPIILILIGGTKFFSAPLFGGVIYVFTEAIIEQSTDLIGAEEIVLGVLIITVVFYARGGIGGIFIKEDTPIDPKVRDSVHSDLDRPEQPAVQRSGD